MSVNDIKQLQEIFEFVLNNVISGIVIATIVFGSYIVKNNPKILESVFKLNRLPSNLKDKNIEKLEKALESKHLSKEIREAYIEKVNRIRFEELNKISTNKNNRIILNNLIKEYNELEWHDIKMAYSYLDFHSNYFSIKIDTLDRVWFKFWHFFNIIICVYLGVFNIVVFYNLFFNTNISSLDGALKIILVLSFIIILFNSFFIWLIRQIKSLNQPYECAIKINDLISSNRRL